MSRGGTSQAGFTLLEMLVVAAVIGLAAGVLVGRFPARSPALVMQSATQTVAGAARLARSRAVATNRPVRLVLDSAAHSLAIDGSPPRPLPPSIAIAVTSVTRETASPTLAAIRFEADGSASGGQVALSDGRRSAVIGIDWLTGRVSVAERFRQQ
ncbi:MAG TPA: GspH/FimT family pseudopilin [Acetobacteraceae bacterium]|nr:GspH/FimT family pseudopilin [Acetobacteraceae bacterium]